jgi:hypothetical protein
MKKTTALFVGAVIAAAWLAIWLLRGSEACRPRSAKTQVPRAWGAQPVSPSSTLASNAASPAVASPQSSIPGVELQDREAQPPPLPRSTFPGAVPAGVDPAIVARAAEDRSRRVDNQTAMLVVAVEHYVQVFGAVPTGGCRAVSSALTGDNPRGLMIVDGYGWTNGIGEFVDPRGAPFRFAFEPNRVTVSSPGPNGVMGDDDDVVRTHVIRDRSVR